jgi:hypothetical protein
VVLSSFARAMGDGSSVAKAMGDWVGRGNVWGTWVSGAGGFWVFVIDEEGFGSGLSLLTSDAGAMETGGKLDRLPWVTIGCYGLL